MFSHSFAYTILSFLNGYVLIAGDVFELVAGYKASVFVVFLY